MRHISSLICFSFLLSSGMVIAAPTTPGSLPVIAVFIRHTFRGPSEQTPPAQPKLSNLEINNPVFAFATNATIPGLSITKKYAKAAINKGRALALKAINQDLRPLANWSLIRPDIATQRTFWTGVYLGKGEMRSNSIPLLACMATDGTASDMVTAHTNEELQCLPDDIVKQQQAKLQLEVSPKLVNLTNKLLTLLDAQPVITLENLTQNLQAIKLLCSLIEFSSDMEGSPINRILIKPTKSTATHALAVKTAMEILGYYERMKTAAVRSDLTAFAKIQYLQSLPAGSQNILVSHDTNLYSLLDGLGFFSEKNSPADLAIYPLEAITFALSNEKVAIVRTRINQDKVGAMTGKAGFTSSIFWSGTRKEWDMRISALEMRLKQYPVIYSCFKELISCHPVPLHLMLHKAQA